MLVLLLASPMLLASLLLTSEMFLLSLLLPSRLLLMFYSSCELLLQLQASLLLLQASLHCKKGVAIFPSPAGMSLTKLSLAGNN